MKAANPGVPGGARTGFADTRFLRFVAIVLITNSHLDALYPDPRFGTGGALGNALFFAASGYGLCAGWQAGRRRFSEWFARRLLRLYPASWTVAGATALATGAAWSTGFNWVATFVWPTPFWFVSAIVLFYLPYYFLMRSSSKGPVLGALLLLFVPYAAFYLTAVDLTRWSIEEDYFKWIFYMQTMLLGGLLALDYRPLRVIHEHNAYAALGVTLALYFGYKLAAGPLGLWRWQFLTHVLTFPFVVAMFRIASTAAVQERLMTSAAGPAVALLGALTLEIYLVQNLIHSNDHLRQLPFPVNVLGFAVITLLLAVATAGAAGLLRRGLERVAAWRGAARGRVR